MVEIRHFVEDWGGATRDAIDAILDGEAAAAGHPFNPERLVFVAEQGGGMLGGLAATVTQGWMHVDLLAVRAPFRRRGIGRALLAAAEALARERGLAGVWLDTVAFQAPDFYPPLGYTVFGRLPDFPPGQERLFFLKRLDGGGAR